MTSPTQGIRVVLHGVDELAFVRLLADVTGFGPEALEMPFGGPRPAW